MKIRLMIIELLDVFIELINILFIFGKVKIVLVRVVLLIILIMVLGIFEISGIMVFLKMCLFEIFFLDKFLV